eukprot:PhF_6_TR22392/c0_g1_i2/m.31774
MSDAHPAGANETPQPQIPEGSSPAPPVRVENEATNDLQRRESQNNNHNTNTTQQQQDGPQQVAPSPSNHHNTNNNNGANHDDGGVATANAPYTKLYEFRTAVLKDEAQLPCELAETSTFYYVVLELAGVPSASNVDVKCERTTTGYEIMVVCVKASAIREPIVNQGTLSRKLGKIEWHAHVQGVFDGTPECNVKDGILKIRMKKRNHKEENVAVVDF